MTKSAIIFILSLIATAGSITGNVFINHKRKGGFITLKSSLNGNYTFLSDKCLNGCNTNLIGFNKAVSKKEKIYN